MKAIWMYILAALFLMYEMAVQVSPSVMAHSLMREWGVSSRALGWVASLYFYSYALMQVPAGFFYDKYGPKKLLFIASLVCGMGSLFFAFTEDIYWAGFGRFLIGFGSAFAFIGVMTVAARWFPRHQFPFLVGIGMFLAAIGALCGAYPIALLVDYTGWRNAMQILGIIGICLALFFILFMRDFPSEEKKEIMEECFHDTDFGAHMKEILQSPKVWMIILYAFCGWSPMVVFASLWGVPFLIDIYGVSNEIASICVSMMWVALMIFSPIIGWLAERKGSKTVFLILGGLMGAISFSLVLYAHLPFWSLFIFLFICGFASCCHLLTFALIRETVPKALVSTGIGLNNMAVVSGGAILQPISGFLLDLGSGKTGIGQYHVGLTLVVVLYVIAFFDGLLLQRYVRLKSNSKK